MYNYHIQYVCITLQFQLYLHMKINITYVNIYIYVFDLHGPRHIHKTRPKLIAIEPKLIAIPFRASKILQHLLEAYSILDSMCIANCYSLP